MHLLDKIKSIVPKFRAKPKTTAKGNFSEDASGRRDPYTAFQIDHEHSAVIADINRMDKEDGRVKVIHTKIARDTTRGGIEFLQKSGDKQDQMVEESKAFIQRCKLDKREKLKGHARFLVKDGTCFFQWVVDEDMNIVDVLRLPATTIRPNVDKSGRFRDLQRAYIQYDPLTNREIASFPRWQITHIGIDRNPDDPGDMGRPWLDASRVTHKKLIMTEEDLVIRRRTRAPQRRLHTLEGASPEELSAYKLEDQATSNNPLSVKSDYYSNKKGSIQTLEGDANLDQIKDVQELKRDFFAGTGIPEHFLGYVDGINRDVYEDTLAAYYEILEEIQEVLADGYEEGLRLQFLLKGINADGHDWDFKFKGRKVESENQLADRMLKHQAMDIPPDLIWPQLGYSLDKVVKARDEAAGRDDPYGDRIREETGKGKITNVQGNARKKESAITVGN